MPNPAPLDEDAVAAADKEMEERANRAKALLSNRYKGLKTAQVRQFVVWLFEQLFCELSGKWRTSFPWLNLTYNLFRATILRTFWPVDSVLSMVDSDLQFMYFFFLATSFT